MDDPRDIQASENGDGCEIGVRDLLPALETQVTAEMNKYASSCSLENDGLLASFSDSLKFDDLNVIDSSVPKLTEVSLTLAEENSIPISKELGEKESTGQNADKPLKVVTKGKSGNLRSPKNATESGQRRIKDGKSVISTSGSSNGKVTSELRPTRPFESRTKSFNERYASDGTSKRVGAVADVDHPKQTGQPASTSSSGKVAQNDTNMEKTKPRVLKKSASSSTPGITQSSVIDGADKPSRVGALPAYGYSFRCNERAEKRKEFYSKLEEKTQAKEEEKSSVQAKTKETQEAEMKMLRKSLTFKATPLPNFYQEPAPRKAELKKIAPTRPKSPKLGRKKGTVPSASEENRDANTRPVRSSLDVRSSQQINPTKDSSPTVNPKKPVRKSLPKLPSQKTNLPPNEIRKISNQKASISNETSAMAAASTHEQKNSSEEAIGAENDSVSSHAQANVDSVDETVDIQTETVFVEEPVAVEH